MHARQPGRMRSYCDLGTNLDDRSATWNHGWYTFRASPVIRRASCVAVSPPRMGWQTEDSEKAAAGAAASVRTSGSAHRAIVMGGRSSRLIRSDSPREVEGHTSSLVPSRWSCFGWSFEHRPLQGVATRPYVS